MVRNFLKYILLVSVLLVLVNPAFAKSRTEARAKACYTNQQIIRAALMDYSYQTKKNISSIIPNLDVKAVEEFLVKEKYLDKICNNPESECKLKLKENPDDYLVYCEYHGNIDGTVPPSDSYKKSTVTHVTAISYEAVAIIAVVFIFLVYSVIRDFHNMAKEDVSNSNKN